MRVGIITSFAQLKSDNYGGTLQNYALTKKIEGLGAEVCTYNFLYHICPFHIPESLQRRIYLQYGLELNLKNRKLIIHRDTVQKERNDRFRAFVGSHIPSEYVWVKRRMDYRRVDKTVDKFIVGSDQVWHPDWFLTGRRACTYLLEFADDRKKYSYAASFGKTDLPESIRNRVSASLSRFREISVREQQGALLIEELTGKCPPVVADPTLLLSKEEWEEVSVKPENLPEKYIATYFLGEPPEAITEHIRCLKQELGEMCQVVNLANRKEDRYYVYGPSEFLGTIQGASIILTDSFHACIFSFLFDKPFVIYKRNGDGEQMFSRLETLLDRLNLYNRLAGDFLPEDVFFCDYASRKELLESWKKESCDFLCNIISEKME